LFCKALPEVSTMANLTLAIDDDLLRAARVKAVQQGTSVNEICRQAIERFAAPAGDGGAFMAQLIAISDRMAASAGPALPMWPNRDAMYDDAMAERMPTLWASLAKAGTDTGNKP
jgi:hypothetical protein